MREALRVYFGTARSLPVYTPTKAELEAIRKGREEIRRSEYYTLDELHASLAGSSPQTARSEISPAYQSPTAPGCCAPSMRWR